MCKYCQRGFGWLVIHLPTQKLELDTKYIVPACESATEEVSYEW